MSGALLAERLRLAALSSSDGLSPIEAEHAHLIHELRLHQLELEAQNRELRETQQALEESRNLYVELYDSAPAGYATFDHQGRIEQMNLTLCRMLGFDRETVIGLPFSLFSIREDVPAFFRHLRACLQSDLPQSTEMRLSLNGVQRVFEMKSVRVALRQNRYGCHVAFMDITERKHGEFAQQLLSDVGALLSNPSDHLKLLQQVSELLTQSLSACCIFHLPNEESGQLQRVAQKMRADWSDADSPRREPTLLEIDAAAREAHQLSRVVHIPPVALLSDPRRPERSVHITLIPLLSHGQSLGVMTLGREKPNQIFDDDEVALAEEIARRLAWVIDNALLLVTLEKARNRSEEAREEAEQANRLKDEFLARVSHELRTPVAGVLLWSHVLRETSPANHAGALDAIESGARAQAKLVDDLLDLARGISGKLQIDLASVDLGVVVRDVVSSLQGEAEAKSVQLAMTPTVESKVLRGDIYRLQQIVSNLVGNAIKFTPVGGRVAVTVRTLPSVVQLEVADTGTGIPREFLEHLFHPFSQADGSSTRRHGGLGLGLAIAKQLVELHGGQIAAESEGNGRGSTFTVTFPLNAATPTDESPHPSLPAVPLPELQGVRVLLVDDDETLRTGLSLLLKARGLSITTAASAPEALEQFDRERPDILLCDIAMPEEDGYSLLRKLRQPGSSRQRVPAVALTALAQENDRTRAFLVGFDAHIPKPVDLDELMRVISRVLQ